MKTIQLGKISILISQKSNDVLIEYFNKKVLFINQTIESTQLILIENFSIVDNHYNRFVKTINEVDLINKIEVEITVHYFFMYNNWRNKYKNNLNQELSFKEKDFTNPTTYDIIISESKKNNPFQWEYFSMTLIGLSPEDFRQYLYQREKFYNK